MDLLAFAALGAAVFAAPVSAQVFDPATFTLDNGLQVVVVTNRRAPIVSHMVWYKVGAADEPVGKSGIAHFVEHLMFKGTREVPPGQFSKIVARNGGQDNAFTTQDYTAYFQNVAKDRLDLVMKLEADRMTNLVLTDAEVLPERDVVLEERRSRTDNSPEMQLYEHARAALFLNHPYRIPIIGWKHEIERLTTADALEFYRRWYRPNNAILIVTGDVTAEEVRPLAEKHYGPIPRGAVPEQNRIEEPPHLAPRRVELTNERVRQPSWGRSWLAPSYRRGATEHALALQVLAEVLGSGATGRLHRSIVVEQGLAGSVGVWYSPTAVDHASFDIGISPRPGIKPEDVEKAVEVELARVLKDGLTAEEVDRAKTLMVRNAIFARDSLRTAPNVLGRALATGGSVDDVERWPERLRRVTVDAVNAAARAVLVPERSVTSVLRPRTAG
ncbi:MAG: insulinase family protein [Alphaproteobacteria bacterium]|nr:insulinase family protein [Alphaproteobacteria bacterium]